LKTATAALLLVAGLVANGCASRPSIEVALVTPDFETSPVSDPGDAADDAVILVGLPDTAVRILATNKQAGLAVYSLAGNELDFLTTGRLNNVDAINIAPDRFLVAASNRTAISIDLYEADLRKDSVVLVCMGRTPERSVFVGDTTGNVEHWVLADDLTAAAPAQRVGLYRFDSQTEGCVFDANDNTLYVGEEDRGIWAVDLASGQRRLLDSVGAGFLVADVEGLDIYQGDSQRLLVASSQGDNTYVLYRLPEGAPGEIQDFRCAWGRNRWFRRHRWRSGDKSTAARLPPRNSGGSGRVQPQTQSATEFQRCRLAENRGTDSDPLTSLQVG
jgi:myo-inositol-hexaphosphate 3-phosphohydrolase